MNYRLIWTTGWIAIIISELIKANDVMAERRWTRCLMEKESVRELNLT